MTGMVPKDVYELTGVGNPRLSPDGRTVAYELSTIDGPANEYRGSIWLAPSDGSAEPRQFTSGSTRDASPLWSPDGSRIAFTSKRASKSMQLFMVPIEGGEAVQLTELSEDVEELDWSPDGTKIVFSARVRDLEAQEEDRNRPPLRLTRLMFRLDDVGWTVGRRRHLFTVPADGSADPTQLTFGDFEDSAPAWSPDGDRIAFTSARHDTGT